MFSWLGNIPWTQVIPSPTVDAVPGLLLPPSSTLMAPQPVPGMTPIFAILPRPQFPENPVPAHVSAVSSILAIVTGVPSLVSISLPAAPLAPLPLSFALSPRTDLTDKPMEVFAGVRQPISSEFYKPARWLASAWLASASGTIRNAMGPYRNVFVLVCATVQQSTFAELAIPLVGGGTFMVKDLLIPFIGSRKINPIEPAILEARKQVRLLAERYRHPWTLENALRPEHLLPKFAILFETDTLPLPHWLRMLLGIPPIFSWFKALLWATLCSVCFLARFWFRKLVAMMPWWLRWPIEWFFPPPLPFTLFLEAFDNYISNELPTHLIRLHDMKLVGRDDIREALRPRITAMTEFDLTYQTLYYNLVNPDNQVDRCFTLAIQHHLKFAIFSHRWGPLEPSFQDMMKASPAALLTCSQGPGFQKLLSFCEEARWYGCAYAWSDTCCINKESSSELQEAIRSMYRWYQNAEICIAYLGESVSKEDFEYEPWFTRGWTLQELLAPRRIKFYGKYWTPINFGSNLWNDKMDSELMKAIEQVTKIPQDDLKAFTPSCSRVYEKMIWASKRRTTRIEDRAYCLLGIFDITMPISYGEGSWAFHRLMEVILERCGESGIFAWSGEASPYSLAIPASPACYREELREVKEIFGLTESAAFTMMKDGLDIELFIVNAKITSARRLGKGSPLPWDETRPSLSLEKVRFHEIVLRPKWTLRRNWPNKSVQVSADERDLQRCSTWAIGIICSRDVDGYARLEAGKEYIYMLIGKVPGKKRSAWVRSRMQNVPTLRIERNVRGRLETVHIPHRL